ncbi:MAG: tetratricopeptide repeat protein, partial [Candidatus Acidiferrum sp.]
AYMGLGFCLVTLKRYEAAIPPLRAAVRLEKGNPSAHYNLATALSRLGEREEAEKEFAIQRQLTQNSAPSAGKKE